MRLPSGSAVPRAIACPESFSLPQIEVETDHRAARGTTAHEFLRRVLSGEMERDEALALVPADDPGRAACEAADLDSLPRGGRHELAVAWDPATDEARVIGQDIGRRYEENGADREREVVMSIDLCGDMVDRRAFVFDFKTGWPQYSARDSWQLRTGAVIWSILRGADEVLTGHIVVNDDVRYDLWEVDAIALADYKAQLREMVFRMKRQFDEHRRYKRISRSVLDQGHPNGNLLDLDRQEDQERVRIGQRRRQEEASSSRSVGGLERPDQERLRDLPPVRQPAVRETVAFVSGHAGGERSGPRREGKDIARPSSRRGDEVRMEEESGSVLSRVESSASEAKRTKGGGRQIDGRTRLFPTGSGGDVLGVEDRDPVSSIGNDLEGLKVTEGGWCKYCPAFNFCPAKTALTRSLVMDMQHLPRPFTEAMTPDYAAKAWRILDRFDEVAKRARAEIEKLAMRAPIDLGDGYELRSAPGEEKDVITDPVKAIMIVEREIGPRAMLKASSTSKKAITAACKAAGGQEMVTRVLGRLKDAGVLEKRAADAKVREVRKERT